MSKIQLNPYINFQGRAARRWSSITRCWEETWTCKPSGWRATGGCFSPPMATELSSEGGRQLASLRGSDRNRLSGIFNGLAEGGTVLGPLAKQSWGGKVGWLKDRFGINWTVNIEQA